MSCKPAFEEMIQQWVTGSSFTFFNRNGSACISMGSQDTSGGVIITPAIQQGSALKPILVTADAPYMGYLSGPLVVTPIGGYDPILPAQQLQFEVADVIAWEEMPPFQPKRAAYFYSTNAYPGGIQYFRMRGRKRIAVSGKFNTTGTAVVTAYRLISTVMEIVDTVTIAAADFNVQFNPDFKQDGTTSPGTDVIDYISINTSGAVTALGVEAWD